MSEKEEEPKYKVTAERSPDLSEEEVRRRLAKVYSLILERAAEKKAAEEAEPDPEPEEEGNEALHRAYKILIAAGERQAEEVDPEPEPEQPTLEELRAVALATDDPAAILAYGRAELERLKSQPVSCWRCGAEVGAGAETCPACGVDLVPF